MLFPPKADKGDCVRPSLEVRWAGLSPFCEYKIVGRNDNGVADLRAPPCTSLKVAHRLWIPRGETVGVGMTGCIELHRDNTTVPGCSHA